jgi:hypothetical protein
MPPIDRTHQTTYLITDSQLTAVTIRWEWNFTTFSQRARYTLQSTYQQETECHFFEKKIRRLIIFLPSFRLYVLQSSIEFCHQKSGTRFVIWQRPIKKESLSLSLSLYTHK